ncbi:MAG: RNA polymerase sigma factor [Pirellulaceae bacterium]
MMVERNERMPNGPPGPELLAWVLDRHAAALELFARQWCDCPEDVVQEALIELARRSETPDDVLCWLYRVVRNRAVSAARSHRRRSRRELAVSSSTPWFVASADDLLDARSAAEELAALPEVQREVVVARLWGGLTFAEIGRLIGTNDSTAHRRYQAALTELRKRMKLPCPTKTPNR